MKFLFIALIGLVMVSCGDEPTEAEVGVRTTMDVKKVYNAGQVVKGEMIRAEFIVTNTGETPLVIADVSTSCSCTVSDYTKKAIPPGKTGKIIGNVDTDKVHSTHVDKTITVMANTTPRIHKLKIKGTIVNK